MGFAHLLLVIVGGDVPDALNIDNDNQPPSDEGGGCGSATDGGREDAGDRGFVYLSLSFATLKRSLVRGSLFILFPLYITLFIKARVEGVEVFAVQSVGCHAESLANLTKSKR